MKTRYLSRYSLLYHPYHASCMSSLSYIVIVIIISSIIFVPIKRAVWGNPSSNAPVWKACHLDKIRITSTWPGLKIWEWVVFSQTAILTRLDQDGTCDLVKEGTHQKKYDNKIWIQFPSCSQDLSCRIFYLVSGGPIPIKGHQLIGDEHVFLHLA